MPLTKGQKALLAALIALAVLLTALLGVLITNAAREQDRLREEQSRLEEQDRTPLGEITTPAPIVGTNGYRLLADGRASGLTVFYFGDEALYGRGATPYPSYTAPQSYRSLLTAALRADYGNGMLGWVIKQMQAHSLTYAATNFAANGTVHIAVLAPTDATAAAGAATHGEGYSFGSELEASIRKMRTLFPHCDILLAVPHGASPETADAILTIGAHYSLVTIDLRDLVTGEGLLHTEGEDAGYPTEAGHNAYAAAIKAAIDMAVAERFSSPELPAPLCNDINN